MRTVVTGANRGIGLELGRVPRLAPRPPGLVRRPARRTSEAGAATGAVVGDRAVSGVRGMRRLQHVLVVDDIVEPPLRFGAVLRRAGLERLQPVLTLVER